MYREVGLRFSEDTISSITPILMERETLPTHRMVEEEIALVTPIVVARERGISFRFYPLLLVVVISRPGTR